MSQPVSIDDNAQFLTKLSIFPRLAMHNQKIFTWNSEDFPTAPERTSNRWKNNIVVSFIFHFKFVDAIHSNSSKTGYSWRICKIETFSICSLRSAFQVRWEKIVRFIRDFEFWVIVMMTSEMRAKNERANEWVFVNF